MEQKNKIIKLTAFLMIIFGIITIISYSLYYFYNIQFHWGLIVGSVTLIGVEFLWIGKIIYEGEKKEK